MEFDKLEDDLLSALDTSLKFAGTVDREAEFEIYLLYRSRANANIKQGIVEATDGVIHGNAVRAAKQNRVSFASSSGISTDRIKQSVNEAVAGLRSLSFRDPRFKGFCAPKKPGREGTFSDEILELDKEKLIEYASELVRNGQKSDRRILMAGSSCSAKWGGFAVGNTRGLQQASKSASNSCSVYCMAATKEERRVVYEYDISRERLIRTQGLGESAARKAVSLLRGKKLHKTATLPTIWEPVAAGAYIYASLGQAARGHNVIEGLSPLADKIGEKIANEKVTIIDDGQNPASLNTEANDAEGYPQQRNIIVENGELSQFMFDTYYSDIYGAEPTGNCTRGSTLPYEASPTIAPKSLEIQSGNKDKDELIGLIDGKGILLMDTPLGIFHSNVSTGEFSVVAQSAFLIQDGEKKWPLRPVSISGISTKDLNNC